jgi:hypothetical protein
MDGETVRAALVVVRLVGRRPLDAADLGQLADFVRHLSLASTREGLDLNPSDGGRATATAVMATEIQDRVVRPMLELREILSSMVGSGDVIPAAWWPVQVAFLDKTIEDARAVMLEVSG